MARVPAGSAGPRTDVLATATASLAAATAATHAAHTPPVGVGVKATIAGRTASPTAAAGTPGVIGVVALSLRTNCYRPSLHLGSSLLLLGWEHAITLGEILADGVRPHGCILHRKSFIFESSITLILAVVYTDYAEISATGRDQSEEWSGPLTSVTKICRRCR